MNLFDLPGPQFLALYSGMLIGAAAGGFLLRWLFRTPGGSPPAATPELDPYEIAYLSGGPDAATDAALAALVHRDLVRFKPSSRTFGIHQPELATHVTSKFEAGIYRVIETGRADLMEIRRTARPLLELLTRRLRDLELVYPPGSFAPPRTMPALLMAFVLLVGVVKVTIGLSRERPVLYLVGLSLLALFGVFLFLNLRLLRTRRGDEILARIRSSNNALRASAASMPTRLAPTDVALATGLFGAGIFSSGAMGDVSQELRARRETHTSGSSCGSGCSGGSSSSCSGGSSCGGGGGCGGCGGGCGGS